MKVSAHLGAGAVKGWWAGSQRLACSSHSNMGKSVTQTNAHRPSGTRPRSAARRGLRWPRTSWAAAGPDQGAALGAGEELAQGRAQPAVGPRRPGQPLGPPGLGVGGELVELA